MALKPEEFPTLCETCLGENPYLRMTREKFGKACKICERPFTVYRWKPGPRARYKKTEICKNCSRLKNVCQTCVLDLEYGLPVQVRDDMLTAADKAGTLLETGSLPVSTVGRGFLYEQMDSALKRDETGDTASALLPYGKIKATADRHNLLLRLRGGGPMSAGTTLATGSGSAMGGRRVATGSRPYYERNLAHICSFYVKGTCTRGATCPYRHQMPQHSADSELAHQNIKDRFYGVNDPVAKKMLSKLQRIKSGETEETIDDSSAVTKSSAPPPPEDISIRTLWIGGVDPVVTEDALSAKLSDFGSLARVNVLYDKRCAFADFVSREDAEAAMTGLFDCLLVDGHRLKLNWSFGSRDSGSSTSKTGCYEASSSWRPSKKAVTSSVSTSSSRPKASDSTDDGSSAVGKGTASVSGTALTSASGYKLSGDQEAYLASMGLIKPSKPEMLG